MFSQRLASFQAFPFLYSYFGKLQSIWQIPPMQVVAGRKRVTKRFYIKAWHSHRAVAISTQCLRHIVDWWLPEVRQYNLYQAARIVCICAFDPWKSPLCNKCNKSIRVMMQYNYCTKYHGDWTAVESSMDSSTVFQKNASAGAEI